MVVIENGTGVYFSEQTPGTIVDAIVYFENNIKKFDAQKIAAHAASFSTAHFRAALKSYLDLLNSIGT
ncbi:MAG: hypothetical protein ACXVB0_08355 [Mucilaginibacter sp.]